MKILVLIKQVPDTATQVKIAGDRRSIETTGIMWIVSPYDEFAVEEALARKEKAGAGETVAYAVGTDASQETLRTALAMGIDRAVLLQSPGSADGFEIATALAGELAT